MEISKKTKENKPSKEKVQSLLITQARPADENSPYFALAKQYNIKVDFRPFIEIAPVPLKDFRKQKINIADFTAIILTSRNAVDNFFRICQELRLEVPADMKYFCVTEQTANYLQKYIVLRKRKVFTGLKTSADLFDSIKKNRTEKFLYPCSDIRMSDLPEFLQANNIIYQQAVLYKTVAADISDLGDVHYDIIAFFSPSAIEALVSNFPDFAQRNTRIAAFGPTTATAVANLGLRIDIQAPLPNSPSMAGALAAYLEEANSSDS